MAFGVTLTMNEQAAGEIAGLFRRLAEAGVARDMLDLGYPPHLTLGTWTDQPEALGTLLAETAANHGTIETTLTAFGVFPAPIPVLWLAPASSTALLNLHRMLHAGTPLSHPHYRPDAWVPHVTLSTGGNTTDGLHVLQDIALPIPVRFEALEIVSFPPARVIGRYALDGGD